MDPRLKSTKELINYFNGLRAASTTVGAGSGRNCFAGNACRGTGAEFPSNSSGENPPQYFNKQAENGLQSRSSENGSVALWIKIAVIEGFLSCEPGNL